MWYFLLGGRILLAAVLLLAGVGKLRAVDAFADSLVVARLSPVPLAKALAVLVAGAEVTVAALLLSPAVTAGFTAAAVLLGLLTAVVLRALRSGDPVECRCFGSSGGPFRRDHAARNAALWVVALAGVPLQVVAAPAGPTAVGDLLPVLTAVGAGLAAALPVVHWDDLRFVLTTTVDGYGPNSY